jgi:hypothetical protein
LLEGLAVVNEPGLSVVCHCTQIQRGQVAESVSAAFGSSPQVRTVEGFLEEEPVASPFVVAFVASAAVGAVDV